MVTLGVATLMLVTVLIGAILWRIGVIATFLFGGVVAAELAYRALNGLVDSGIVVWGGTILSYSIGASLCFVLLKLLTLVPRHPSPGTRRLLLAGEIAVVIGMPLAMGWELTGLIIGAQSGLFDIGLSTSAIVAVQVAIGLFFVFAAHRQMRKRHAANDDRPVGLSPQGAATDSPRRRNLAA